MKIKKLSFFIVLIVITVSCSIKKKPVFLKVDNFEIISLASDTIRLKASAFFENPNDIGGKLATDEIKVLIDGVEVAQVSSDEFKIPARKEFIIPLKVVIPTKKVFDNNKNGILGGLINSFLSKKIKVQFKGDLKYKVFGYSDSYSIDKTEEIKIKL